MILIVLLLLTKSKTKYDLDIFHEIHPAILYTNIHCSGTFSIVGICLIISSVSNCKNTKMIERKRYQFLDSYQSALYIFYEIVYYIVLKSGVMSLQLPGINVSLLNCRILLH